MRGQYRQINQSGIFLHSSIKGCRIIEPPSLFADPDTAVFLIVDPDPALQNCDATFLNFAIDYRYPMNSFL